MTHENYVNVKFHCIMNKGSLEHVMLICLHSIYGHFCATIKMDTLALKGKNKYCLPFTEKVWQPW